MKRKDDFVTNSSSCSFVAWGKRLEVSEILENEKLLDLMFREYERSHNDEGLTFLEFKKELESNNYSYSVFELLDEIPKAKWIDLACPSMDEDIILIGGHPSRMDNDQTLREYKEEIREELNKLGIDTPSILDLDFIQEEWDDR